MTKQEQLIIILLILAALIGTGLLYSRKFQEGQVKPEVAEVKDWKGAKEVVVEVKGACWRPGVYTFPDGTRVKEAVEKAGSRSDACLDSLNLARRLKDGEEIFIPRRQPDLSPGPGGAPGLPSPKEAVLNKSVSRPGKLININLATREELEKLPQIGPKLAGYIVAYRDTHGPFRNIEEIKKVEKIGEGKFGKIKDLITVEGKNGKSY